MNHKKSKNMKRIVSGLLALTLLSGGAALPSDVMSNIASVITAQAATYEGDCYSFDEATGVLTLKGEVTRSELYSFGIKRGSNNKNNRENVSKVIAEPGTVLSAGYNLFQDYYNCTYIDLSNVDTSKATNMYAMFESCYKLTYLDIGGFDTSHVTSMENMFCGCSRLTSLNVSSFDTSNVESMRCMFSGCKALTSLNVSSFDTSNVTSMEGMFCGCEGLTSLDLSGFDTSNVTTMMNMFASCYALHSLNLSGFDTKSVTTMYYMFSDCKKLHTLNLSGFDTKSVTTMYRMFAGCNLLLKLDLSSFDTSNVTDMRYMFSDCYELIKLDLSSFDTSNATDMNSMFYNCKALHELDLSSFDTSNVTDMSYIFYNCSGLTTLDLSSFDTSNVTRMGGMFSSCSDLLTLDLRSFNTNKIKDTNMGWMFKDCSSLKTLILGEDFKKITESTCLPNHNNGSKGWVNVINDLTKVISGDGDYAVIENSGVNIYKLSGFAARTYPTNIKYKYSSEYRQLKFTWDKVEDADKYGIAVYLAGKWRVQRQDITKLVYTTPKNSIIPGSTYRIAIVARVHGIWDTANALKRAVTVTIRDSDHDDFLDSEDPDVNRYNYINIDDSLIDDTLSIIGKNPKITQADLDEMIGHVTYGKVLLDGGRTPNQLIFTRTRKKVYNDGKFTLTPSKNSDFVFTISDTNETKSVEGYSIEDYNSKVYVTFYNKGLDEPITPVKIIPLGNGTEIKYVYSLQEGIEYTIYVDNPNHNNVGEYEIHVYEDNWVYAPYGGVRNIEESNDFALTEYDKEVFLSDNTFFILDKSYMGAWNELDQSDWKKDEFLLNDEFSCETNLNNAVTVLNNFDDYVSNKSKSDLFWKAVKEHDKTGDYLSLGSIFITKFPAISTPVGICISVAGILYDAGAVFADYKNKSFKSDIVDAMMEGNYNISITQHKYSKEYGIPFDLPNNSVEPWYSNNYIYKYKDGRRGVVTPFNVYKLTIDGDTSDLIPIK